MKPKVVFVHGLFGSSSDWDAIIDGLGDYACEAIILPGHGLEKLDNYSVSNLSRWLFDKISNRESSPVHFVGYSLGGRVLLSLFEMAPKLFASITLESTSPGVVGAPERMNR